MLWLKIFLRNRLKQELKTALIKADAKNSNDEPHWHFPCCSPRSPHRVGKSAVSHSLTARAWAAALWVHGSLLSLETKLIIYLLSETHSLKTRCQPACNVRAFEQCPPLLGSIRRAELCAPASCASPSENAALSPGHTVLPVPLPRATDSPSEASLDSVPSSPFQACNDLTHCCHVSPLTPAAARLWSSPSSSSLPTSFYLQASARPTVC